MHRTCVLLAAVGVLAAVTDAAAQALPPIPCLAYHVPERVSVAGVTPAYGVPGDVYTIKINVGVLDVVGGTKLTVNRIRANLDCLDIPEADQGCFFDVDGCPCDDDGPTIAYEGDASIATTCPTTFSTGHAAGTSPNEVVFTAATPFDIPAEWSYTHTSYCDLYYDVRISARPSNDAMPDSAPFAVTFQAGDSACDNGSDATYTLMPYSIFFCPASCDDGDACTADSCDQDTGACVHSAMTCDDANICTTDSCDSATGCSNVANTLPCSDGDPCTVGDHCEASSCQSMPKDCADGDLCTEDTCTAGTGECTHVDVVTPTCDDGNACTEDTCVPGTGGCSNIDVFTARCDDGNPCTTDTCSPATGDCLHADDVTPTCDDGDACTTDRCVPATGECEHVLGVVCADPVCDECVAANGLCLPRAITPPGCEPSEDVTLAAVKDTYLTSKEPNLNEGANPLMVIKKRALYRPLVGFDLTGVDRASIDAAQLVLSVKKMLGGWKKTGGLVETHSLLVDFEEGNGKHFKVPRKLRTGTGAGVTFDCESDADIANKTVDCGTTWSGGAFGPASGSFLHLKAKPKITEVSFDVTADVRNDTSSWLLKKPDESRTGGVFYWSREGAVKEGNPALAPRLVISAGGGEACTASAEVCDGVDNDCNGIVDDGLGSTTCGVGACARTVDNCVGGVTQTCVPGTPGEETCNGIDNDCNGAVDDGQVTCGVGACERTVTRCVDHVAQTCTPETPSSEVCDGVDNDCNGSVDDGFGQTTCGVGYCAATIDDCVGGALQSCVRFVDNGDGTVTDNDTCLMWEKKTGMINRNQDGALVPVNCCTTFCSDPHDVNNAYSWSATGVDPDGAVFTDFLPLLNDGAGFAGHTDWRLPLRAELLSIVDTSVPGCQAVPYEPPCIASIFGPTNASYWTSETNPGLYGPGTARLVTFSGGFASTTRKWGGIFARAVRPAIPDELTTTTTTTLPSATLACPCWNTYSAQELADVLNAEPLADGPYPIYPQCAPVVEGQIDNLNGYVIHSLPDYTQLYAADVAEPPVCVTEPCCIRHLSVSPHLELPITPTELDVCRAEILDLAARTTWCPDGPITVPSMCF